MMHRLKLMLFCFCLTTLNTAIKAEGTFEDAEAVNEFITMSFSTSHPYDLRHTIPGEPDIDYPIYSAVPKTNFDCNGRHEGYYADIETRCQVFRICANTDLVGRGFAFLCPNGTLFSQKNFVCDWYRNVDCSDSERYYSKNDGNRIGTKNEIMETVRQMMEHPMKTITIALNRAKPVSPQPITYNNVGISTTKDPRIYRTSSAPVRNIPTQQVPARRQPITLHQVETAFGVSQQYQGNPLNGGLDALDSSPSPGIKSTQTLFTTIAPSAYRLSTLSPAGPTLGIATNDGPLPSQEAPLAAVPTYSATPLPTTERSADEKEVYVSNLGELSTDPGANFDPQTARIIAEPTSSSNDVQVTSEAVSPGSPKGNKMNFAQKVNAGLNGLQVVNRNEIIAPEYVQNILHKNVAIPGREIQPPSFEFASNVNSLLDEVAYETELEGQNSMQVQLRTPSDAVSGSTRKPFRFLSRGFSYQTARQDGPYVYGPPTSPRNTLPSMQHLTSTQSYSSTFITTPLFTTPAPVTSTEASHITLLQSTPQEPAVFFNPKSENSPNFGGRATNELIQRDSLVKLQSGSKASLAEASEKDVDTVVRFGLDLDSASELDSKATIKREQKEGKNLDLNEIPQELGDDDKANANKRAEKLLLAGFKQTILDNLGDKSNKDEPEVTTPIVPLYIRVTESQTSPATTTSTTTVPSTTSTLPPTTRSTTTTTTATPQTTPTQSIRRYTVSNVHRRQSSRPIVYTKRQNVVRSALRTTTPTTTTTASSLTSRFGSGLRSTSTTTTLAPTRSPARKRPTVSRFTIVSRRRNVASTTSTTTTTAAPSKKLAVRSSDKEVSDLTAVASTYNAAPKRDYNSIRQNSYKYVQTQRRRPNPKTNVSETTSTTSTTPSSTTSSTTTTHQPRRSSSLPTPTLAPFSHEALSSLTTTSTTPAPLPATYLSFNDLTKAIIDDSILQTFRRNKDNSGSTLRPPTFGSQTQAPLQSAFVTAAPRSQERSTQRTAVQSTTRGYLPLKEFIASKFGAHYSPSPPNPSSPRPVQTTPAPIQAAYVPQYPRQQYVSQTSIKSAPAVHHVVQQPLQQNVVHQQPQFVVQQQQVPQQQYYQLRQQQLVPVQQYVQYQQQVIPTTAQPLVYRPVQTVQLAQPVQQGIYRIPPQQQRVIPQQQPQRASIQQGQQILQRTISPVQQQQQQQFQRNLQTQPQRLLPPPQPQLVPIQQQQSQIQIFPSQMTASQTIPAQQPNTPSNTNAVSQLGSINVRLPTNLAGLIPNSNLLSTEALGRAQNRIDQPDEEADAERGPKSAYSGVSSYEVPLSSVGRLANDITHLLRRIRRL